MAAILFSAAAITDYLDGYIARTRGLVSTLGKVMDPVADKLLVSSAFIMLTALGWVPAWIVCIIIGREIAVTGLRNIIAERGEDVSASNLGKYKTGFQIAAIIPLMIHYPFLGLIPKPSAPSFYGVLLDSLSGPVPIIFLSSADCSRIKLFC